VFQWTVINLEIKIIVGDVWLFEEYYYYILSYNKLVVFVRRSVSQTRYVVNKNTLATSNYRVYPGEFVNSMEYCYYYFYFIRRRIVTIWFTDTRAAEGRQLLPPLQPPLWLVDFWHKRFGDFAATARWDFPRIQFSARI